MELTDTDVKKFKTDLTPRTRRLVVGSIGVIGIGVVVGWALDGIAAEHALIIIPSILTGFFSLLKGSV